MFSEETMLSTCDTTIYLPGYCPIGLEMSDRTEARRPRLDYWEALELAQPTTFKALQFFMDRPPMCVTGGRLLYEMRSSKARISWLVQMAWNRIRILYQDQGLIFVDLALSVRSNVCFLSLLSVNWI